MCTKARFLVGALAILALNAPLMAHHSVAVNFDTSREIIIEGVLTEVVWRNPHSRFRVDVTEENGSTVEWLVEFGAFNTLNRAGFPSESFAVGDSITITGNPGRNGQRSMRFRVALHAGRRLTEAMSP